MAGRCGSADYSSSDPFPSTLIGSNPAVLRNYGNAVILLQ